MYILQFVYCSMYASCIPADSPGFFVRFTNLSCLYNLRRLHHVLSKLNHVRLNVLKVLRDTRRNKIARNVCRKDIVMVPVPALVLQRKTSLPEGYLRRASLFRNVPAGQTVTSSRVVDSHSLGTILSIICCSTFVALWCWVFS